MDAELARIKAVFDAMPPEVVKKMLIDAGGVEAALSALADVAKNSESAEAREEARSIIEEYDLGFILLPTTDDPPA